MKVIYIAGKYTAPDKKTKKNNIKFDEKTAQQVWKRGMAAICPHLNTKNWDNMIETEEFLEGYLSIVKKCDAVLMLNNWKDSEGAEAEHWLATTYNVPVFYNVNDLDRWNRMI